MTIVQSGDMLVPVRKYWYQFWLPRYVSFGGYTRLGNVVTYTFKGPFGWANIQELLAARSGRGEASRGEASDR